MLNRFANKLSKIANLSIVSISLKLCILQSNSETYKRIYLFAPNNTTLYVSVYNTTLVEKPSVQMTEQTKNTIIEYNEADMLVNISQFIKNTNVSITKQPVSFMFPNENVSTSKYQEDIDDDDKKDNIKMCDIIESICRQLVERKILKESSYESILLDTIVEEREKNGAIPLGNLLESDICLYASIYDSDDVVYLNIFATNAVFEPDYGFKDDQELGPCLFTSNITIDDDGSDIYISIQRFFEEIQEQLKTTAEIYYKLGDT